MERFFINMSGIALTFTEEGIIWSSIRSCTCFPYGSLKKVKIGFLGFEFTPKKGNARTFAIPKDKKAEMLEMLEYAKNAIKKRLLQNHVTCQWNLVK